jgi:hypothetical protein
MPKIEYRKEQTTQGDILVIYRDDEPVGNLRQIGKDHSDVEFRSSFLETPIRAPMASLADVSQQDVERFVNKYIEPAIEKARTPSKKKPWEMTKEEYFGERKETGASATSRAWFGRPYFMATPDKSYIIGERFKDHRGQTWEVTGQNDLHVPYVTKVVGGKVQKKQYVGGEGDMHKAGIVKALSEGKPVPAEVLKDYPELGKKEGKPEGTKEAVGNLKIGDTFKVNLTGMGFVEGAVWKKVEESPRKGVTVRNVATGETQVLSSPQAVFTQEAPEKTKATPEQKTEKPKATGYDKYIGAYVRSKLAQTMPTLAGKLEGDVVEVVTIHGEPYFKLRLVDKSTMNIPVDDAKLIRMPGESGSYPRDIAPTAKPEPKAKKEEIKYTPVEKLPDNELWRLYLIPEHRDMPQDYKEYLAKAKVEFNKRKVKLGPIITALPTKPKSKVELKANLGDTISDGFVSGKVIGEGTVGSKIPAYKIETSTGRIDLIIKNQVTRVTRPKAPHKSRTKATYKGYQAKLEGEDTFENQSGVNKYAIYKDGKYISMEVGRTPLQALKHHYKTSRKAAAILPSTDMTQIDRAQDKRGARAVVIDNSLLAKRVLPTDSAGPWLKRPNRFDIRGVDTPGRGRIVAGVAYADRGKQRLSRKHHRGFSRIKFT